MKKVLREMKSSLKKGISFLAIIAMVLTCCNVREAKAESYLEPVGGIREVVLVLDVSGSMSGTPMTANIDETLHPGFCELNGELSKVNDNLIQYTCDEYQITYEVVSCYGSNYNVDVTITNRTDETIHNWILAYDSTDVITNIWNGTSEGYEEYTLIKNVGYNQDIYPGESVNFGFVATKDEYIEMPGKFRVITEESEVQRAEYEVEFEIVSDWKAGYNGRITILNKSSNTLSDWMLEFDYEDNIDNLWNGNIVSHENGKYIVRNATYNHNINPGESVSIEFTVSERVTDSEPKNYKLTTVN